MDCRCKNYKISMVPMVTLNNGMKIPQMGLGTWLVDNVGKKKFNAKANVPGWVDEINEGNEAVSGVRDAIDVGYRMIDTAELYSNEKEIGEAIHDEISNGTTRRSELFVVTKLWNTNHKREDVMPAVRRQLKNFGLDYFDLYLMHWPVAQEPSPLNTKDPFSAGTIDVDYLETWHAMEECVEQGLLKSIGVSNFNSQQIQRLLDNCKIKPVINEIEVNLHQNNKKLIKFCKDRDIELIAYSPLGSPARAWLKPGDPQVDLNAKALTEIGEKYRKTGTQVNLRYLIDIGVIPIPKSRKKERLIENLNVFDFKLTPMEIAKLDEFHTGYRVCPAKEISHDKNYPFNIEF